MENFKQKARKLRKGLEDVIPVPLEQIAKREGVGVKYGALEGDISGFLFWKKGKAVIGINAFHAPTRQRFTLAHELAHFALKHHGEFFVDRQVIIYRDSTSSDGVDIMEREANGFAAELLMPEDKLMEELNKTDLDLEDEEMIQELADKFGVSKQAMTYRIVNLLGY